MYNIVAMRPFLFVLGKLEPQCASLVFRLIVIKSSTLSIFSHSSFSLGVFSPLSLKKQVLAWIREKLHHFEEKKRNGKEGGNMKKKKKKVATRPKYICTYKAVLMKAKLI